MLCLWIITSPRLVDQLWILHKKNEKLHTHAINLQLDELKEEWKNSLQKEIKLSWMSSEFYASLFN